MTAVTPAGSGMAQKLASVFLSPTWWTAGASVLMLETGGVWCHFAAPR